MWLNVKQLGEYLNIKPKTIYTWVSQKIIPYYKVNRLVQFNQNEIDAWMKTKRIAPIDVDKVAQSIYNTSKGSQATSGREA